VGYFLGANLYICAGAELSGRYSPASSVISVGPDIPTAPESPWMSDFYDSEVDTDNPHRFGSRETTLERPRAKSNASPSRPAAPSPSATNYLPYRSRNILDRGPYQWPSSAPSTLERPSSNSTRSDLFDIARRRRGGNGALHDWINSLLSHPQRQQSSKPTPPTTQVAESASPLRSAMHHRDAVDVDTKFPRLVQVDATNRDSVA